MKNSYIVLTVILKTEDEGWTAECQELGTAAFGDTYEETNNNINEAISLHLDTLDEVGERERFFKEQGIKIHSHDPFRMRNWRRAGSLDVPYDPKCVSTQSRTNYRRIVVIL